jgi:hypothetical protein
MCVYMCIFGQRFFKMIKKNVFADFTFFLWIIAPDPRIIRAMLATLT